MKLPGQPFEDEVRYVARQLWPKGRYKGALRLGVNELDGVTCA
jgi:hypothetical protein